MLGTDSRKCMWCVRLMLAGRCRQKNDKELMRCGGLQVLLWLEKKAPAVQEQALGALLNLSRGGAAVKRQLLDKDLLWIVSQVSFPSKTGPFSPVRFLLLTTSSLGLSCRRSTLLCARENKV